MAGAVLALLAACPPAFGEFPGTNGKLAFSGAPFPGAPDIHTINPDGTGQANLTNDGAADFAPAWSPDGRRIAFSSNRAGNFEIWVMWADGSGATRLTNNAALDAEPAWSPDGTKIAFQSDRDGDSEIWVMDANGANPTQLTSNPALDASPNWSPNGSTIAFIRAGALFTMAANGSSQALLDVCGSLPACTVYRPDWSPGGTQLLYALDYAVDGGVAEELRSRIVSSGQTGTVATGDEGPNCCLLGHTWAPDGTRIAYARNAVVLVDPDGSNVTSLSTGTIRPRDPDWQPTGVPEPGFPRPRGATPLRASLVVAYPECTSPNRLHGPPLASPSCGGTLTPPTGDSPNVTVGTPDWNSSNSNFSGSVRMTVITGNPSTPQDEADVQIGVDTTDIRCMPVNPIAACGTDNRPNTSEPSRGRDYSGELRVLVPLRITDRDNLAFPGDTGAAGTVQDGTALSVVVPCVQTTTNQTIGSSCTLSTTADAVLPGLVPEQKRLLWAMQKVEVTDGGTDGDAHTTGDNERFLTQGVFVP